MAHPLYKHAHACMRACIRACACVCARAHVHARARTHSLTQCTRSTPGEWETYCVFLWLEFMFFHIWSLRGVMPEAFHPALQSRLRERSCGHCMVRLGWRRVCTHGAAASIITAVIRMSRRGHCCGAQTHTHTHMLAHAHQCVRVCTGDTVC